MKIQGIKQGESCAELSKPNATAKLRDEFTRVLAEESEKIDESIATVQGGTGQEELPALSGIGLVPVKNDFSDLYRQAELSIEGTICRLERLQTALLDPKGGLKGIASAIGELSAGGEELRQCAANLPANHLLRQMADEMAVLAHVESVKFRRGDYN